MFLDVISVNLYQQARQDFCNTLNRFTLKRRFSVIYVIFQPPASTMLPVTRKEFMKKYPCDQCEGIYSSQHCIKQHKDRAHKGIDFPCDACDYNASRKYHLKRHIHRRHNTSEEKDNTKLQK